MIVSTRGHTRKSICEILPVCFRSQALSLASSFSSPVLAARCPYRHASWLASRQQFVASVVWCAMWRPFVIHLRHVGNPPHQFPLFLLDLRWNRVLSLTSVYLLKLRSMQVVFVWLPCARALSSMCIFVLSAKWRQNDKKLHNALLRFMEVQIQLWLFEIIELNFKRSKVAVVLKLS